MPVASRTRPSARTRSSSRPSPSARPTKERVLVEFPAELLKRADEAARKLEKNRSELIRTAVEQLIDSIETKRFEQELASAYQANAGLAAKLSEEFSHIDREGF